MPLETVTVLFTDVVGSTELSSRIGSDQADEIRRDHFAHLRVVVDDHGGRVVKNLGDGLMVAFSGVAAGLAAASAMQQTVASGRGGGVAIRIGLSTGEVEVEEGDLFGAPVVEAARLCAMADGGEILAPDLVRSLLRDRGRFEFDEVGPTTLKGLPGEVVVQRVLWDPLSPADALGVPVPPAIRAIGQALTVGRVVERERLQAEWKAAQEAEVRGVLLSGEPGIGKSTLAASFALDAAEGGAVVVHGGCDQDVRGPYQAWSQALDHLLAHLPDEVFDQHHVEVGPVLGRIVPAVLRRTGEDPIRRTGDGDPRHELFSAVVDLLGRVAASAPVIIVLDDLHWADRDTVLLVRHVLESTRLRRVLVIGTFRDSDIGLEHPLAEVLASLHRTATVERMALRGLDDRALLELMESLAGHELGPDALGIRDALLRETDGNPFFVGELLRHLRDTGGIFLQDDGRWGAQDDLASAGLPVSIREVVGQRVRRLGDDAHGVLTAAAVLGREFDLGVLEQLVEDTSDRVGEVCDAAVEAAVLEEGKIPEEYRFAHALIERTLYDDLSATRRGRLHRKAAEAIQAVHGDGEAWVGSLAHHWARATRSQSPSRAAWYARRAGEVALARFAPDEAVRWFREAIAQEDPGAEPRDRIELRVQLGEALAATGDLAARTVLFGATDEAIGLGEPDLIGIAAERAANCLGVGSVGIVDEEAVAIIEAALGHLGDIPSTDRAKLLAALARQIRFDPEREERAARCAREAVALARELGDGETLASVTMFADMVFLGPATTRQQFADSVAIASMDDEISPTRRSEAALRGAQLAFELADRDAIESLVELAQGLIPHIADRLIGRAHLSLVLAPLTALDGDPDATHRAFDAYREAALAAGDVVNADTIWGAGMMLVAFMRGETGTLIPLLERLIEEQPLLPVYRAVLARALAMEGERARAAELLAEARADRFARYPNEMWLPARGYWAYTAWHVADAESADILVEQLEPWTDRIASTTVTVSCAVAQHVGMARHILGDLNGAIADLELAGEIHRRMRAPHMIADSDLVLANVLADRGAQGDRERARELATASFNVAKRRGYGYVQRDAELLLERLG